MGNAGLKLSILDQSPANEPETATEAFQNTIELVRKAEEWGYHRFWVAEERTGLGDTPEQVASFRVPRDQVLGYAAAAHRAIIQRVLKITPEQFDQVIESVYGDSRPVWRILAGVIGDSTEHVGQINYLRGMTAGLGWR